MPDQIQASDETGPGGAERREPELQAADRAPGGDENEQERDRHAAEQ